MSYVPVQDLLAKTNSIYKLVVLASKRAAELDAGSPPYVEANGEKICTVALEEIAQGKIKLRTETEAKKKK